MARATLPTPGLMRMCDLCRSRSVEEVKEATPAEVKNHECEAFAGLPFPAINHSLCVAVTGRKKELRYVGTLFCACPLHKSLRFRVVDSPAELESKHFLLH
jgi:hypothetical protein